MPRTRLAIPAAILVLAAAVAPAVAQPTIFPAPYGTAELGEILTGCFSACFDEDCSGTGTVSSLAVDAPFFVRGIRKGPDTPNICNLGGVTTPATLPVNLEEGEKLVWDVDLVPTALGGFQSLLAIDGVDFFDLTASVVPVTTCNPSATDFLCLTDDRFKTRIKWRTRFGTRGAGQVVTPVSSDDSGLFYFFNADNWEMLIKVLDACQPPFDRFWVFASATTNVEYTITVTDTQEQVVKTYFNPLDHPATPIQDTAAFATCP
jgi:hypothetical protein